MSDNHIITLTLDYLGSFDTNYILFRNVENFEKQNNKIQITIICEGKY
jgi:hypothetical protein